MTLWQRFLQKHPRISELEMLVSQLGYPFTYFNHLIVKKLAKEPIHVIGDSHVQPFAVKYPFIIHYCGAATAHNLIKEGSTTRAWNKIEAVLERIRSDSEQSIVLFVFGEIDARIHIYNQHKKTNLPIHLLCERTVQRYGLVLKNIKEAGFNLFVLGITPASRVEKNHFGYVNYGTPKQRSEISNIFNIELRRYCRNHGLVYIDLYGVVADDFGFIKPKYCGDGIHLNGRIVPYVKREILNATK
jgi:hypothetical protein